MANSIDHPDDIKNKTGKQQNVLRPTRIEPTDARVIDAVASELGRTGWSDFRLK